MPEHSPAPQPVFVVCIARSGSTLLRYILDTHASIDAPAELHLGPLVEEMTRVTRRLVQSAAVDGTEVENTVIETVRAQLDTLLRTQLNGRFWCDKSVSTIDHLPVITQTFPEARYLFLYRNCMDFVHSALEVSKYGFEGHWFEDFVLKNPENLVDSLARFWCMQTDKRLAIEQENSLNIHAIRYEDIVRNPTETVSRLFDFLELPFDESLLDAVFEKSRGGGGDIKIQSTNRIENQTGKGREVPVKLLEADTLKQVNALSEQLGYEKLSSDWNFETETLPESSAPAESDAAERIQNYLRQRLEKQGLSVVLLNERLQLIVIGLSTWEIDFSSRKCIAAETTGKHVTIALKIKPDAFLALMDQSLNFSMAVKQGKIAVTGNEAAQHQVGSYLFASQ